MFIEKSFSKNLFRKIFSEKYVFEKYYSKNIFRKNYIDHVHNRSFNSKQTRRKTSCHQSPPILGIGGDPQICGSSDGHDVLRTQKPRRSQRTAQTMPLEQRRHCPRSMVIRHANGCQTKIFFKTFFSNFCFFCFLVV